VPSFAGVVGCLSIALFGMHLALLPAAAQQAIETRTLFDQRIERLPAGPLCWDVRRGSLAPGSGSPASGFHVHGWVVAYVFDGLERFQYDDGRADTIGPTQAALFEQGTPHRHESIGAVPRTNIGYELTCERLPNSIDNTGTLPGIRSGVPYQIQMRERVWPPGAQTPVHILSGPSATYVLEGTIARTTSSGTRRSGPGELYVSPVGELAQNTNVGAVPARTLDVDLWPAGEVRSTAQPGARLPSPIPAQLPRTGGALPWAGVSALGLGLFVLAAGVGARRVNWVTRRR